MNILLLLVCIALGIATYHFVMAVLDLFIKDEPRKVNPVQVQSSALGKDATRTKRRMNKAASRYRRLRGTV